MKNNTKKKAYTEYFVRTNPFLGLVVLWIAVGELIGGFKFLQCWEEKSYIFFLDYWFIPFSIGVFILIFGLWIALQAFRMFGCHTYIFRFRNFKVEREARHNPKYHCNKTVKEGQDNNE